MGFKLYWEINTAQQHQDQRNVQEAWWFWGVVFCCCCFGVVCWGLGGEDGGQCFGVFNLLPQMRCPHLSQDSCSHQWSCLGIVVLPRWHTPCCIQMWLYIYIGSMLLQGWIRDTHSLCIAYGERHGFFFHSSTVSLRVMAPRWLGWQPYICF